MRAKRTYEQPRTQEPSQSNVRTKPQNERQPVRRVEVVKGKSYSVVYEPTPDGKWDRQVYAEWRNGQWAYLGTPADPEEQKPVVKAAEPESKAAEPPQETVSDWEKYHRDYANYARATREQSEAAVKKLITPRTRSIEKNSPMQKVVKKQLEAEFPQGESLEGLMTKAGFHTPSKVGDVDVDVVVKEGGNEPKVTLHSFPSHENANETTEKLKAFSAAYRAQVVAGMTNLSFLVGATFSGDITGNLQRVNDASKIYTPRVHVTVDASQVDQGYRDSYVNGLKQIPSVLAAKAVEAAYDKDARKAQMGDKIAANGPGPHLLFGVIRNKKAQGFSDGVTQMREGAKAYFGSSIEGAGKLFVAVVQEQLHGALAMIHRDLTKNDVEDYGISMIYDKEKADALRKKMDGAAALAAVPLQGGEFYYLPIGGKIPDEKSARLLKALVDASQEKPLTRETALALEKRVLSGEADGLVAKPHSLPKPVEAGSTHEGSVLGTATSWIKSTLSGPGRPVAKKPKE